MKTSVTYSLVQRKNPRNEMASPRYYAKAQARGVADIRSISDRIEIMCTVTRADVVAVLTALETCVSDSLANGEIVRLGELGSLQISLSSKGAPTKEEFNSSMIDKSRILFRPGETLSKMQQSLSFERVAPKPKKGQADKAADLDAPGDDAGLNSDVAQEHTEDTGL